METTGCVNHGCFVGALVIAPVLEILYHAYGFTGALPRPDMDPTQALSAPQATIMTTISKGIFTNQLEWTYIFKWCRFRCGVNHRRCAYA